jgi:hypothetical protein
MLTPPEKGLESDGVERDEEAAAGVAELLGVCRK